MFDIYLTGILGGIAVALISPDSLSTEGDEQLFGLAIVFAWVFIESCLLATIGTTPGKWLFRIRLVARSGSTPDFAAALSRSFKVWWRGIGIGFPLASLITMIVAHRKLSNEGVTSWDRDDGFTVVHERIGPLRAIVAVAFFAGFLLLVVAGSVASGG
jgi:hypothetical protein